MSPIRIDFPCPNDWKENIIAMIAIDKNLSGFNIFPIRLEKIHTFPVLGQI